MMLSTLLSRFNRSVGALGVSALVLLLGVSSSVAWSAPPRSSRSASAIEQRLERLEALTASRALLDMNNQLRLLQSEVRQLRGQLEESGFEQERLRHALSEQRQEVRRLNEAQRGMERVAPTPPPAETPDYRLLFNDLDTRLRELESAQQKLFNHLTEMQREQVETLSKIQSAPVSKPTPVAPPVVRSEGESELALYKSGFDHIKAGRYAQAELDFKLYLERFPEGGYADHARYWLGESAFVVRDFALARAQFNALIQTYPQSAKIPDAWLKLGLIHYEEGDYPKAREWLERVRKEYSSTHAANLARQRIEMMTREGH